MIFEVIQRTTTPVEHVGACFGLAADLAELFDRKIDLVELSATRTPIFRESVEETRRNVYVVE